VTRCLLLWASTSSPAGRGVRRPGSANCSEPPATHIRTLNSSRSCLKVVETFRTAILAKVLVSIVYKNQLALNKLVVENHSSAKKCPDELFMNCWYSQVRRLESKKWWPHVIWVPLVVLLIYVALWGVDIPFGDPWATLLPHIIKFKQGTLGLADLLSQNNEHRPLFLRLILIPLAVLTQWNTRIEMGVQIGFSVATFLVIKYQLTLSWKKLAMWPSNWLLLIISLLVFSLNQWENWLNGYQLLFSLFAFVSVSGLFLLANSCLTIKRFFGGVLCAIVAQFTISAGAIFWGVGLILLLTTTEGQFRKALFASIWIAIALISTFLYFRDFHFISTVSKLSTFLLQPHIYLLYVLTFLGAPIMTFYTASILGVVGTGLLISIVLDICHRHSIEKLATYLPYVALCFYSLLIALSVGIGRMGEKWWLALSPRYVGLSVWFWVGLVSLLSLRVSLAYRIDHPGRLDFFWRKYAKYCLGTVLILSIICSIVGFGLGIHLRYLPLRNARTALMNGNKSDETLAQIYPDTIYLRQQLPLVEQYHLSIYR
jgi:hypothetical protein